MARMRYIKPEFWTDSKVVSLSRDARLLFIGMWNFAVCDAGHLPDDALALKLKVLPADPVDAEKLIDEIVTSGMVTRGVTPDGRAYLHVIHLIDHQKTDSRWASRCPYCTQLSPPNLSQTQESSGESSNSHQDSAQEGIGGERRGETKTSSSAPARPDPDEQPREDVDRLCRLLVDLMLANGCRKRNITKAWRREMRLLLDRDGISAELAEHVLRWALNDHWWKSRIESPEGFRKHFDKLRQQRRDEHERSKAATNGRGSGGQPPRHIDAALARDVTAPEYDPIAARLNGQQTLIGDPA